MIQHVLPYILDVAVVQKLTPGLSYAGQLNSGLDVNQMSEPCFYFLLPSCLSDLWKVRTLLLAAKWTQKLVQAVHKQKTKVERAHNVKETSGDTQKEIEFPYLICQIVKLYPLMQFANRHTAPLHAQLKNVLFM